MKQRKQKPVRIELDEKTSLAVFRLIGDISDRIECKYVTLEESNVLDALYDRLWKQFEEN